MDSKTRSFITVFSLLVLFEITESKGLCQFAEMFPSKGSFQKNTVEKEDELPVTECPPNMVYENCSCQVSCDDPTARSSSSCDTQCMEPETCLCADVFLKEDKYCVPPSMCGCYINKTASVIPNNETYVNAACSEKCICQDGQLICNANYECSPNAACTVKDGVRQCYCNEGYGGDGQTCTLYKDCYDGHEAGQRQSGIYTILPVGWPGSPFDVYCDMTTAGGGWTVFQRRIDRVTNFFRNWASYRNGFGSVQHGSDFWLGNEQLYYLTNTNQRSYKLRIDIVTSAGLPFYIEYAPFRIDSEGTEYRLVDLGSQSGTAADLMYYTSGRQFSTFDDDNDGCELHNCAEKHKGAWWHNPETPKWCSQCYRTSCLRFQYSPSCSTHCTYANLNGDYNGGNGENIFRYYNELYCNLTSAEMKIRPIV